MGTEGHQAWGRGSSPGPILMPRASKGSPYFWDCGRIFYLEEAHVYPLIYGKETPSHCNVRYTTAGLDLGSNMNSSM